MEKEKTYHFYCDFIKKEMNNYCDSIDSYLLYLPDLFKLLTGLLDQRGLKANDRKTILCALGYIVAPNDVIPERVYGPAGYVDDIYLCCWVLQKIIKKYGNDFVSPYWENSENSAEEIVKLCLNKAKAQLKEIAGDVLEYAGLRTEKQ